MAFQGQKVIRLNINLSTGLYSALYEYAHYQGVSMNQVMRDALGAYMGVFPDGTPGIPAPQKTISLADLRLHISDGDE